MNWNLLHLTDLHLASDKYFDDQKLPTPGPFKASSVDIFKDLLQRYASKSFDAILITGDVTTKGKIEGLDLFAQHIVPVLRDLCRVPRAICIVPGNHDVAWGIDMQRDDYFNIKFQHFREVISKSGATSCLLPVGTVKTDGRSKLEFHEDDFAPIYIDHESKLIVLCINSSMRCGEVNVDQVREIGDLLDECRKHADGLEKQLKGNPSLSRELVGLSANLTQIEEKARKQALYDIPQVTEKQIEQLRKKLTDTIKTSKEEWRSYLKVAILHHHLTSFPSQITEYKAFEILPDATSVINLLKNFQFHLALTGHKHQAYFQPHITEKDSDVIWIGGGSTVCGDAPSNGYHGFRHIRVHSSGGKWSCQRADIDLLSPERTNPKFLSNAIMKASPTTIGPGSVTFGATNAQLCQPADTDLLSADTLLDKEHSDEWVFLISVISCKLAREAAKSILADILKEEALDELCFVGFYDLYGSYDLLIRMNDTRLARANHKKIKRNLQAQLESGGHLSTPVNINKLIFNGGFALGEKEGSRRHLYYRNQDGYRTTRSQKAFIIASKTRSEFNQAEIERMCNLCRRFYKKHQANLLPSQLAVSWTDHDLLIEVFLRCGQYYLFEELTREIEDLVDVQNKDKQTHMAYCHEEFCKHTRA